MTSDPVLKLPDRTKPFVLRTDSSSSGLGAVLLQYHNSEPFPVAYASKKLLDRETRYSTIERECLGIIFGVEKFKYYLLGSEFILETDHKPLVYIKSMKNANDRIMRWALALSVYRFRIVHLPGAENVGADYLSRT